MAALYTNKINSFSLSPYLKITNLKIGFEVHVFDLYVPNFRTIIDMIVERLHIHTYLRKQCYLLIY